MAREALAQEDKILSENYFQHADHFTRVQNEQESTRMARVNSSPVATVKPIEVETKVENSIKVESEEVKKTTSEPEVKKIIKTEEKKIVEKKSAAR